MKLFVFIMATFFAFEQTSYDFLEGLSKEEIKSRFLGLHDDYLQDTMLSMFLTSEPKGMDLPESFDWTQESKCIHPVRNQGHCGSCWAHSASEVVSDRFCIHSKGKVNETFSP